jgi:hypothetical protein
MVRHDISIQPDGASRGESRGLFVPSHERDLMEALFVLQRLRSALTPCEHVPGHGFIWRCADNRDVGERESEGA